MITILTGPADCAVGDRIPLDHAERHHLRVRRARSGEVVVIRDGAGLEGTARLIEEPDGWSAVVDAIERRAPPAALALAVGAGDGDRFGWLVEKAAEVGVTSIVPIETARTRGVGSRLRAHQLEKLRRRAREAIKQSGATWVPVIEAPTAFAVFLAGNLAGERWLADAAGAPPMPVLDARAVTVLIGPEGGLTEDERAAAIAGGFRPTTLGPHTLRFETAALAAAIAVSTARLRGSHE